jgi:hypothetical protein
MRFDARRDRSGRAAIRSTAGPWRLARAAFASLGALAALTLGASALGANPPVYRWVDENGVVHYGDHVPPQYAQSETAMLNREGIEVGRTAAQKSPAQLEQDARLQQQLVQQKQRDSFLLTTYGSVHEIEQLRDERLQQLQGQRLAAEQFVSTLNERLLGLQTRAEGYKPYSAEQRARRLPDDLAEDLVHTMNEIRGQREALATHEHQEATIRAQFQADIDRYRELKTDQR